MPSDRPNIEGIQDAGRPVAPLRSRFATTNWSIVLQAGKATSPTSKRALECLCETYWFPLYVFLRRRGLTANDAEDYTQAFITRVLEKDFLRSADPQRGRFRSFLLTMLQRFLATELERQRAQKRGGNVKTLSLDFRQGENRYQAEPVDRWTPERLYDRRWALTLLEQALVTLREEFAANGKEASFDRCHPYLTGTTNALPYSTAAEEAGISAGALRVEVHRLRRQFRELLIQEIAQTVQDPEDVDSELQLLQAALRGD